MQRKGALTNRIPVLRAEMRWSQQELADRVGVSRQTIASLEANKYNPSLILAFEIAKQFSKNIYEVFDYEIAEGE
ncbi:MULTISPECIES: helix-turn-helix transcriptional regulator [Priestia]|uniref:helix-turn-helix transcriptional regulator n=1 Tax=Priestia TaxID=2800373 RepID=UPI000421849F|nr:MULTISPECIES: helix-turn-helix transcriptional regulator [Priestia]MBK0010178.1 helix-turn-helix transcriptional regulator [Bacillus sp. S35]MCM3644720.1 helix-turn-helix transcriptional regulator [Priestia aryabhattai]PFW75745.1 transcriptional regulator [Priestia aryabhattai]